jgi:hypothetical protein
MMMMAMKSDRDFERELRTHRLTQTWRVSEKEEWSV